MYTRSYQRREDRDSPGVSPPPPSTSPTLSIKSRELPEGYSGTALLREKEPDTVNRQCTSEQSESAQGLIEQVKVPRLRAGKYRVITKVTPSLLSQDLSQPPEHGAQSCESVCKQDSDFTETHTHDSDLVEQRKKTTVCDDAYEPSSKKGRDCARECDTDTAAKERANEKPSVRRNGRRLFSLKKHRFNDAPPFCKEEKRFSIEDLLLGGLILLLLNEGADDGIILIFGYLLFSSF